MNLRDRFNTLQFRERMLLIGGGIVLLILAFYLWVLEPLSNDLDSLRSRVQGGEAQLSWMNNASNEVKTLRATGSGTGTTDTTTSLITVVERTASQIGIRPQVKRMEPQGNNKLSIELVAVPFDPLMEWLGNLEQSFAAKVIQLSSTRSALPGRVDARIIIGRDD